MKKIPTLFVRDENDRRYVTREVTPGCEWVLAGEGVATRKYDGTCVRFDDARWWARREVKPGKCPPDGFRFISRDDTTGKSVGWEPAEQSGFKNLLDEARAHRVDCGLVTWEGTYELIGPEGYTVVSVHANWETRCIDVMVRSDELAPVEPGAVVPNIEGSWQREIYVEKYEPDSYGDNKITAGRTRPWYRMGWSRA